MGESEEDDGAVSRTGESHRREKSIFFSESAPDKIDQTQKK